MDKKSPDAFRTISEVAEWLGVPTHVLRFWESRFTQVKPVKRAGGRRYYRPNDMELLGGIRKLLHEDGMTIRGVQKLLREHGAKHVAAMSPPIDSDQSADETANQSGSNVVSIDAGRDADAAAETSAPEAVVETAPTVAMESDEQPEVAPTAPPAPDPLMAETAMSGPAAPIDTPPDAENTAEEDIHETPPETIPEAPMAFPSSDEYAADMTPAEIVDMAPAPVDASSNSAPETAETSDENPSDPLEPIPHDGPTIAETLAANDMDETAAATDADLPNVTPDEVVLSSEETVGSDTIPTTTESTTESTTSDSGEETGMDLFAFADTVSTAPDAPAHTLSEALDHGAPVEDTPVAETGLADDTDQSDNDSRGADMATRDDETPSDDAIPFAASIDQTPDIVSEITHSDADLPHEAQEVFPEETAPPTVSDTTATFENEPADAAPVEVEVTAETEAPAPQLGDISHIPADPTDEGDPLETASLTSALRVARKSGTGAHLPVLQALADRLDALSVQMNRSGRG